MTRIMENPLKDCLTIQVSEEDVNSPDFDLSNYMNKTIKKAWFKKALEFEQIQYHFPFNNVMNYEEETATMGVKSGHETDDVS